MKKLHRPAYNVAIPILSALYASFFPVIAQETTADVLTDPIVDMRRPEARAKAVAKIKTLEKARAAKTRAKAIAKGLKMRTKKTDGGILELVDFDGEKPVYLTTFNTNAAISTSVNLVQVSPYLLDGSGIIAGVWDGGAIRPTHQEFANGSRVSVMDGAAAIYHASHVGGTIGAQGVNADAKGMAPNITLHSYDWNSDQSEMTSRSATSPNQFDTKIYLSNHSYGYANGWNGNEWLGQGTDQNAVDTSYGQYDGTARDLDSVAYGSPYYLMFWAAGNELEDKPYLGETVKIGDVSVSYNPSIHPPGDGEYRNGFECIGSHGIAKNLITVGAAEDAVTSGLRDPSKASLTWFSSTGPTDDGRIKPDLIANGYELLSPTHEGDSSYGISSGTSMAAPNATGSAALVIDQYKRLFNSAMRASTLKGLLLHTATDIGNPGPDYKFGWGLIDTKKAVDLVRDHHAFPLKSRIIEDQVTTSITTRVHSFLWDGASPLRATVCWTDPAGMSTDLHDSRNPSLVNNLNLKLIAPDGAEYFPYVMPFVGTWTVASMNENATTGINNTDNVETVNIPTPGQIGTWQAVVTYTGALTNGNQAYGLILSGTADSPNTVNVISPNGGESFSHESSYPIRWASNVSGNLAIELLKGGTLHSVLSANEINDGSFTWTVLPSLPLASDYAIRLRSVNNPSYVGTSAGTFTILPYVPGGSGSISREVWTSIPGTSIADIPVDSTPGISDTLTSFETPSDWADDYGTRIRGYITPPSTGSYTFWIASDDNSELWLSSDNRSENKVKIAEVNDWTSSREWNKFSSQKSLAINLIAGNRYFVEVLQKEGGGGDNLAVGWAKPGQSTTSPSEVIPGAQLSPFDPNQQGVEPTFTYYRFTPTRLRDDLNANSIQLSEFEFAWNTNVVTLSNATITNPSGSSPGDEGVANISDGNTATKWLDFNRSSLVFQFMAPTTIDSYRFATANDESGRDPISWRMEGSQNGISWVILEERNVEVVTTERFTYTNWFVLPNDSPPPVVNTPPVANAQSVTTSEDTANTITLIGTDAEGQALTYIVVSTPANGTLSGTAPSLTYTPNANFNGTDSFTFRVYDGTLNSTDATVSINVAAVNDVPVAISQNVTTAEDTALAITLSGSDVESNPLTYSVVSAPANGTLSGVAPNLIFSPSANFSGSSSFSFKVNDGTLDSPTSTISITVTPVNDTPVFIINPIVTAGASENVAYIGQTVAGLAIDGDAGDSISYSKVSGPSWLLVDSNGTLSGIPPTGSAGLNSFQVRATDSSSASANATLQITVTGLPLPWISSDIGIGMLAGSTTFNAGTFTQAGSGVIGSTSDRMRFTYQTLTGDGEIIARISSLQNTGSSSRVGVVIRDSLGANSKQIFMGMSGTNAFRWMRRTVTGGSTTSSNSSTGTVPNTWVRLVRSGTTITAFKSSNGSSWTNVGSTTNTTFASTCYIGLAVSSGSNSTLNTSLFSNVSVTP